MRRIASVLAAMSLFATGCVIPGPQISPYGRQATTRFAGGGEVIRGELLAATSDTVWFLENGVISRYPTRDLSDIAVRRHPFTAQRAFTAMMIGGGVTAVAMMVACGRYNAMPNEGNTECGPVLPVTLLLYALPGLLFATGQHYNSQIRMAPSEVDRLRPYARFPQGIPDSVRARLMLLAPATIR
jgi:hypothetical protein